MLCYLVSSDVSRTSILLFFFFNDTATTEIYTLSLHDALPICRPARARARTPDRRHRRARREGDRNEGDGRPHRACRGERSEEHTSELQSPCNLVCRLLLEKKKRHEQDQCTCDTNINVPVTHVA